MPAQAAFLTDEERRDRRVCRLCGIRSDDVVEGMVMYLDPEAAGRLADAMPRCRNAQECRDRVEAAGDEWIIRSHTVSRVAEAEEHAAAGGPGQARLWL